MAYRIRTRSFVLSTLFVGVLIVGLMLTAWTDFSVREFVLRVLRNYHIIRPDEDPLSSPYDVSLPLVEGTPQPERYRRVQYERFASYLMPVEIEPETLASIQRIVDAYAQFAETNAPGLGRQAEILRDLHEGRELTSEQWAEVAQTVDALEPLTSAMRRAALQRRWRPDQFHRATSDPMAEAGEAAVGAMLNCTNALCLEALRLLHDGRGGDALEEVSRAADLLWPEPVARMALQQAQNQALETVARTWAHVVKNTNNPIALDYSLQRMNAAATRVRNRMTEVPDPLARHLLSRIRATGRKEAIAQIERTTPDYLLDLYRKARTGQIEEAEKKGVLNSARAKSAREIAQKEFEELEVEVGDFMVRQKRWADMDDAPTTMLLTLSKAQELRSLVDFDLTRVFAARKLAGRLNPNDPGAQNIDVLSPRFLTVLPIDPFSEKAYRLDPASGLPYSPGPDGRDQNMKVMYDPTNGATSEGDVFLEWLRE